VEGLISQLKGEDLLALCGIFLGLVAILGGISIGLVAVISHHFRRSRMDDIEATLKMEMLERGMSAAEIQQVLEARGSDSCAPQGMAFNGFGGWRQMRREMAKPSRA
jgi:hypothetical protein